LKVRDWLHERNLRKERTVAKDLLAYLESGHILPTVQDSPQGRASSIRSVQRYIKAIGWRRGRRSRKGLLKESPSVLLQRDQYIQFMIENVTARRVVYLDESYIHHHYKNTDDSLFDPNDERLTTADKHKGRRYCFIGAILSADPLDPTLGAEFLHEVFRIFVGGSSSVPKKETKDYHGMFDSDYFVDWTKKLLQALSHRRIQNAVIVLDNAKYHKSLPATTPKSAWKVADMRQYCQVNEIPLDPKDTKRIIQAKMKPHLQSYCCANVPRRWSHHDVYSTTIF
jgi:hypothetical protein